MGRPVTRRTRRSSQRLASVADSVKDHWSSEKRRASSAPTHSASSLGSIVVTPPRRPARSASAATRGSGECPAIAPVSPRAKSASSWPSRSVIEAPRALANPRGKPPDHIVIQVIGTRATRWSAPVVQGGGVGVAPAVGSALALGQVGQTRAIQGLHASMVGRPSREPPRYDCVTTRAIRYFRRPSRRSRPANRGKSPFFKHLAIKMGVVAGRSPVRCPKEKGVDR